jgi:ribA/ribD-fused uncharacterized protein
MCGGYPIEVIAGGVVIPIRTTEALYQAMRFPDHPDIQREVISQKSPMTAKMKTKPHRATKGRQDWDQVRVQTMYWCNQLKLAQNWKSFRALLDATGDRDIVEYSTKDPFWGARPINGDVDTIRGHNTLGKVLMRLREKMQNRPTEIPVPKVDNFLLYGKPVEVYVVGESEDDYEGFVGV